MPRKKEVVGLLEVPLEDLNPEEYVKRTFSLCNLTFEQARMLRRIFLALNKKGACLKSGRPINKPNRTFRWILENITIPDNYNKSR
jgi:hypothetical protein